MIDVYKGQTSVEICFFSDASCANELGMGGILNKNWICAQWPRGFIETHQSSISYLELYTLTAGILTWEHELQNTRITVFCDNMSVKHMINNTVSSCKHCMILLHILTLNGLQFNRRLRAKFVPTKENGVADALSRLDFACFRRLAPMMNEQPDTIDVRLWPINKLWDRQNRVI